MDGPPCPFHLLKVDQTATVEAIADYFRANLKPAAGELQTAGV